MLPYHATNSEVRRFLFEEIGRRYPEGEASSIARLVLEHLGTGLQELMLEPEKLQGPDFAAQIKEIVREIHTGKPLQYILGYAWFFDLKISVNDNVLIPRPETEEMVYKIRDNSPLSPSAIMDLCSGSGCLALALKKLFPGARVSGLELSDEAIRTSQENSRNLGLEVEWLQGDVLEYGGIQERGAALRSWGTQGSQGSRGAQGIQEQDSFDLVVSNPPYVRESEKALMEAHVLDHEPHMALFVPDNDPLVFYRATASFAMKYLSAEGALWLEINEALGPQTLELLQETGFTQVHLHKDIHEKDRFIHARK